MYIGFRDNNQFEEDIQGNRFDLEEEQEYIINNNLNLEEPVNEINNIPYNRRIDDIYFLKCFLKFFSKEDCSFKNAEQFIKYSMDIVNDIKLDLTNTLIHEESKAIVEQFLENILAKMNSINSTNKITNKLKDLNLYNEPEKIVVRVGNNDERFMGTLFPIESIVRRYLEKPRVLNTILEYQRHLRDTFQRGNILDGSLWMDVENTYPNENVIPIFLYEDDMNPDNSLGPHVIKTNLAMFYLLFPTLPDFCFSSIRNVKPLMVTNAENVSKSPNTCLLRILEELKKLEDGIYVKPNEERDPIKIRIVVILAVGDNLALNTILGFCKTFTTDGFCRICIITREESKVWFIDFFFIFTYFVFFNNFSKIYRILIQKFLAGLEKF